MDNLNNEKYPWDYWAELSDMFDQLKPKKNQIRRKIKVKSPYEVKRELPKSDPTKPNVEAPAKNISPSKLFLLRKEWVELRKSALAMYGSVCHKCGTTKNIQVDHIKPKSKYPELSLDINNLQILCWTCNRLKSNTDETDYRK